MKAKTILNKAIKLVDGDRKDTHGDMVENHENIARLWNGYLWNVDTLTGSDVANMMEILKVARRKLGALNADDYVDGGGYSGVSYECKIAELKIENKHEKTKVGRKNRVGPR
jgi:exopolysaccharide biosynthesis protein